jgi:hypothetical protein
MGVNCRTGYWDISTHRQHDAGVNGVVGFV